MNNDQCSIYRDKYSPINRADALAYELHDVSNTLHQMARVGAKEALQVVEAIQMLVDTYTKLEKINPTLESR